MEILEACTVGVVCCLWCWFSWYQLGRISWNMRVNGTSDSNAYSIHGVAMMFITIGWVLVLSPVAIVTLSLISIGTLHGLHYLFLLVF